MLPVSRYALLCWYVSNDGGVVVEGHFNADQTPITVYQNIKASKGRRKLKRRMR